MFESYIFTQQYWWFIVSLLGAILVFLMFVQGGQMLIYPLGKTETERTLLVNSLGRKWELTFTTLVTFGGAFFAAFPLFYSTSFGGAYWVWLIILFAFIIQAVSYEFRTKPNNFLGQKTYEAFLFINGALGTLLIGTAIATFYTGSEFSVERLNITNIGGSGSFAISQWQGPAHGLEAALNVKNLLLGFSVLFLSRVLGLQYFMNNIADAEIKKRAKKHLKINAPLFLIFFITFIITLLLDGGFAVKPEDGTVYMQPYKYFHNFIDMPLVALIFLIGVGLVLFSLFDGIFRDGEKSIWFGGSGTILVVLSLFLIAGYNNTAFYPSTYNLNHSLTIYNASSNPYTLKVMSYVSLLVPFVLAYITYVWRAMNRKKLDSDEIQSNPHSY